MRRRPTQERLGALGVIAALGAPLRRAIYVFVSTRDEPVARDEAAAAVRSGRPVATFHLEKLVDAGLLEVAPGPRKAAGRGRPAKLYRPRRPPVEVSVPPRNYGLFGKILRRAERGRASPHDPRLMSAARDVGRELGREARNGAGHRRWVPTLVRTLDELAYEPKLEASTIRLRNCPVRGLAEEAPEQVCALNLALLEGLVQSVGAPGAGAVPNPAPSPGACCVVIRLGRI